MLTRTLRGAAILMSLLILAGGVEIHAQANEVSLPGIGTPMTRGSKLAEGQQRGCTVFTLSKGDQVFFGGNDDYIEPDSYYWVDPPKNGSYGAIWIGTPDNVQQGVNEMGLAYDANGLPRVEVNPHTERTTFTGAYTAYPVEILRQNASVAEVIEWVTTHEWHAYMHDQMHFADANGDAVVISAGTDGELVFTRKPAGDSFLVSTNFNVANPGNAHGYPCWRYDAAQRELGKLLTEPEALEVSDVSRVLETTHVAAAASWTIGSMLADLSTGKVYLYYFHQFDQPVVLDVAEQLADPPEPGSLSSLFPQSVQEEASRRYQRILARTTIGQRIGLAWLGSVVASLALFMAFSLRRRLGRRYWLLTVIVLGPLGLLIWSVTPRSQASHPGSGALIESLGDVASTAIAYLAMLLFILLAPGVQSSDLMQLLLLIGLPLATMLLLFHGPLRASATELGLFALMRRRFPDAVVSANLGMAGANAVATPFVSIGLSSHSAQSSPIATLGLVWLIAVAGALVGGGLLWIYNRWAVRQGYGSWSLLLSDSAVPAFPGWRRLKWWIPLSFLAQIGGVVLSIALQGLLRG